jgi:hypothetical protein
MASIGRELSHISPEKQGLTASATQNPTHDRAKMQVLGTDSDAHLAEVVKAWAGLSPDKRAGVLRIVRGG